MPRSAKCQRACDLGELSIWLYAFIIAISLILYFVDMFFGVVGMVLLLIINRAIGAYMTSQCNVER